MSLAPVPVGALVAVVTLLGFGGGVARPAAPGPGGAIPADTVVAVAIGDGLRSHGLQGRLRVVTWDDDGHLELEQRSGDPVRLRRQGGVVHIEPTGDPEVDLVLRVPGRMALELRSTELWLQAENLHGKSLVDIVEGEVELSSGTGDIRIRLAEGDIHLRDVDGRVDALALDGDVRVTGGGAELFIEVVDGDVVLRPGISRRTRAATLDGDVTYEGAVDTGGELELSTHDGDVTVSLPENVDARFEVATWDGSFSSEFPVRTSGVTTGETVRFRTGSSDDSSLVRLTSFDGDIRILRGGGDVR